MKRSVVVIDSDPAYQKLLANILNAAGYEVATASGGSDGYARITSLCPDLIITDSALSDADGMRLIRSVREWWQTPILVLSSAAGEKEKIRLLDAGADAFLQKPFSSAELLAILRVMVRHITQMESLQGIDQKNRYSAGGLSVDYDRRTVFVNGKPIHLTRNEYKILSLLCHYGGKVLTYDFIMRSVWGPLGSAGNGILRVNVTNIRRKIEPDPAHPIYLFTANGVGYHIASETE